MRGTHILGLVLLNVLLAAIPADAAAASPAVPDVSVEFELPAGQGFTARLENFTGDVTLTIYRHHQYVSYQVKGEVTPSGVVARFGKLGQVSVAFTPTKTVSSLQPPKGCKGEAGTDQKGVFSGTIQLTGEREYVRLDATSAKGEMRIGPHWDCRSQKGGNAQPAAPATTRGRPTEKNTVATLRAFSHKLRGGFSAVAERKPKGHDFTFFAGGLGEHRESMKISRLGELTAPSSTFRFNHAQGTASVRPPWPFSGSASFTRHQGGSSNWSGSLMVRLLGADPIALTGPSFRASLVPEFPGD